MASAIEVLIETEALQIGSEAMWFRTPGGARVDLSRRKPLRLVLSRLVAERVERPGSALDVEAVLAAGWPGERVIPEAGAARVYVAVSTLRKLGLRDLLISRDDGYLINPEVSLQKV